MLRNFSLSLSLTILGSVLIAIAFISISSLPLQVESSFREFIGKLGVGAFDLQTAIAYRRIIADRYLLQSIYIFLTGMVLLVAGLFKTANR